MALYAFVDKIDASPTIIQHLDDRSPLIVVEGVQMPEANRNVSASRSSARNGDNVAQKSYGDGRFVIPLEFAGNQTALFQSETIQTLNRILDGESWLLWQPDGVTEPVFHRVKYGTLSIDTEIEDETPKRTLTLDLVTEYASYGLPVTNTVTIANDPTAASNPMSYVFPDIQGDVATPLQLLFPSSPWPSRGYLSISSGPSAPALPRHGGNPSASAAAGWSYTSGYTDSSAIGGTTARFVKSSGSASQTMFQQIPDTPPGTYRLMLRMRSDVVATVSTDLPGSVPFDLVAAGSAWVWRDAGVVHLPGTGLRNKVGGLADVGTANSTFHITLTTASTTATIDLDSAFLLPAGLDDDSLSSLLLMGNTPSGPLLVDAIESRFEVSGEPWPIAGGFPFVQAGSPNVLTLMATSGATGSTKTNLYVFTYLYYPRYLYTRPASS